MDEARAARMFSALGSPVRLQIYRTLVQGGGKGLPVGALRDITGVPPSTLAHHLRALVEVGLVRQERRGREVISTADYEQMNALAAYLVEECCRGVPAA